MKRALAAVILALAAPATAGAKPPMRLAPPTACTSANRMDVFIDEDWILWECQCQMLKTGNICAWQVIGGVDDPATYHRKRIHPRHVVRIYAHPGIVG